MKKISSKINGFTLMEVLVVIAIVSILSSIALASMSDARANARDKIRVADISQIELALRLYVEQYGSEIDCENGVYIDGRTRPASPARSTGTCNDWKSILDFLKDYFGTVPIDPKGDKARNSVNEYYYYFDNNHTCSKVTGGQAPIVFAVKLEKRSSNATEVCGRDGNDGAYQTNVDTAYAKVLNFTTQK